MGKKKKKLKKGLKRVLLKGSTGNHSLLTLDKCAAARVMLQDLIKEYPSLPKKVIAQLKLCTTTLDEAILHSDRSVTWSERMAHDRLSKCKINKPEPKTPNKRKSSGDTATVEKKKSRPKRQAALQEEERRRIDGRAEAVQVGKMKRALSIYQEGATKPSTPEEIGKLLASATKISKKCFQKCLAMCVEAGLKASTCYRYRKCTDAKDYNWPAQHDCKGGCPRMSKFTDMAEWKRNLGRGRAFTHDDIKAHLKKQTGASPCKNSVNVYFEELVQDPQSQCRKCKKVYNKTEKRWIAENSRRAVISLGVVTCLTHAIPTSDSGRECNKTELDKMIPYPHHWANPNLIFNNDDTTYVAAALKTGGVKVYAAPNVDASGAFSTFTLDKKTQNYYQRIKSHCSASFSGILGPFILSTKIKEREWGESLRQDIVVMTIPGLCSGGDLSPLEEPGYLVLMKAGRSDQENESREQKLTRWMFEKVWIPYVERIRERLDPSYKAGDDPPSWLTCIWWFDGAIPPLKAVTSRTLIEKLIALAWILNKGNPGRTGVEQLLDVFDGFKRSKHWVARGTFPGATQGLLGASIQELFMRYHKEYGMKIPAKKRNLIIDFVSQYPAVVRKSFTSEGLIKAVTRVGKYSPTTGQPELRNIFRTIPADLTDIEEFALLEAAQNLMKPDGPRLDLSEADLERESVPADKNPHGEIIPRDFDLKQEWRQRAKCCSTDLQREGRQKIVQAALLAKDTAKLKKSGSNLKILRENTDAEKRLKEICKSDNINCTGNYRRMFKHATLDHFAKLKADELKSFIFARNIGLKFRFKQLKSNAAAARRGEECTILTAYNLRLKKVTLTAPTLTPATAVPLLAVNQLVHRLPDDALAIQNDEFAITKIAANTEYTDAWTSLIKNCLPLGVVSVSDSRQDDALTYLESQLRQRLTRHIRNRIPEAKKRLRESHVWNFVRMNLQRVCMVLIMSGHVLPSDVLVHVRGISRCLLAPAASGKFLRLTAGVPLFNSGEGVYLYWDPVNGVWVRSGKISGRPFARRHEEHLRSARAGTAVSGFYAAHSSSQCQNHVEGVWTGVPFETLHIHAGVSWTQQQADSVIALLWWPEETIACMKRSVNWRGDGMRSIHAIHPCHPSMPSIHAIHPYRPSMPSIHAIHPYRPSMPSIHAIHPCHPFIPSRHSVQDRFCSVPV